MNLASLNTPQVANAGATLVTASAASLGGMVTSLASGGHPSTIALVCSFAGIAVGLVMAYCGRPSTLTPKP